MLGHPGNLLNATASDNGLAAKLCSLYLLRRAVNQVTALSCFL
jgi:hypothetical protein